ncbi:MAG: rhodanese-like domain-containing protein [Armatimonadota bacterium]
MKANAFKRLELRAAPNDALQALVIVLIGLYLALVSLAVAPKTRTLLLGPITEVSLMDSLRTANFGTGPIEISVRLARSLGRSGTAVFVDARASSDCARGHIPNAVNLPYDTHDKVSRIASIAQVLSLYPVDRVLRRRRL